MAWFEPSLPFVAGWGAPPQLHAPEISGLVGEILKQRRYQDTQARQGVEGVAEAIKNIREERQSQAYLDSLKAAGLVPQDYEAGGVGGAKYGSDLATRIQHQKEYDERIRHQKFMEGLAGRRVGIAERGRSGGGDGAVEADVPEDYYGLSVAPGAPSQQTTRIVNGVVQVRKAKGRWEVGPKWMQDSLPGQGGATGQPDTKAIKEQGTLLEQMALLEDDRKKQEAKDIAAGAADPNYPQKVPFKQSDLYNRTRNRLEQLQKMPGMPSTAPPGALPTATPSDQAGGHADNYGVRPSAAILARAQQALDDPEATEEEKAQARRILSQ